MENQEAGVLEISKRRQKKPRRSSILKRALVDINNGGEDREKRRVSFKPSIMVKEFQKNNSGELETSAAKPKSTEGGPKETFDDVYMVPANQSYYQMSTPVGDKRRRLSAATVSRLSIIPPLEKSFASSDDTPDFELFEDSSEATAPKEAITLQEPMAAGGSKKDEKFLASINACDFVESTKQENETFNLSCMDHASVAGNALVIKCPTFNVSSLNSPSVDHDEMLDKPAEEGNTTVLGESSMELTLEGEQLDESDMVVDNQPPLVAQSATHLEPFASVHITSQHVQQDLIPVNDVQDLAQTCSKPTLPTPDSPQLQETTHDDHSVKNMSLTNSYIDLHEEDSPQGSMVDDIISSQASHQPVIVSQPQPVFQQSCHTVYGDADMSLTSVDGSHMDLAINPQPNEEATARPDTTDSTKTVLQPQPQVPSHTVHGETDMSLTSMDCSHMDVSIKPTNEEARPDTTRYDGTMMMTCVDTPVDLKSTNETIPSHHDTREKLSVDPVLPQPSSKEVAEPLLATVTQTQPILPVADEIPNTDGQNQPCSTNVATISHPVISAVAPAMPQVKPPPIGFKRPRHVLANSIVSKRMAFGKTRAVPKPNTPKLATGQIQHLQLPGSGMPPLRSPSITASLLKKKSRTPSKIVTAQIPPTLQPVSAVPTPASARRLPPCSPLVQSMSIPADIEQRNDITHVIEQRHDTTRVIDQRHDVTRVIDQRHDITHVIERNRDSPATESPGSSIAPCTTTYTVAPQTGENENMDESYKEKMMPNTGDDDDWLTNNNDNPSILVVSADVTPAVLTSVTPAVHDPIPSSHLVHSPPPSSHPDPVVHSPPSSRPGPVVHSPPPSSRPGPVVHIPPPSSRPDPVVHSPPSSRPGPVVHSPPASSRPGPVIHSPPPSSRPGPVVHSPPPSSRPGPVVHSPPPSSRPGPVVHSPLPSSRPGPVVHSLLPSSRPGPVVHSPPPSSCPGPVVHSPPPSSRPGPVVHSPPLISSSSTVLSAAATTVSSATSNALASFTKSTHTELNPDVITTPHLVVLDQFDTTISPLPVPALSVTMDQSRLEPIATGGMDRTIRVISPTALGKFAAFANADRTINLAAEYEQQLLQEPATPQPAEEHSAIASHTLRQEPVLQQSIVDPVTPHVQSMVGPVTPKQEQSMIKDQATPCVSTVNSLAQQSMVDPATPEVQSLARSITYVQQDEEMMEPQLNEGNKTIVLPEEEKPSAENDTEEQRELHISAVQLIDEQCEDTKVERQSEVKKEYLRQQQTVQPFSLPDETHGQILSTSLPLVSSEEDPQIIINLLDDLHMRFKSLHKVTLARVLSNYCSSHEGLRERLEHYYEIIHCCIAMIRCLIDYSRLTDMAEMPCSVTLQPSQMPDSDQDIRGELVLQARWLLALCKTLEPLYNTCHKAMAMLFKRSGWVIHSWKRDEVNVHFGKKGEKLQLKFVLDTNQSEGKYGKIQCQKVTEIIIESKTKGCSVPKGLKCSSVLDIPVALQMVSLAV